jgi:arylsulfatase A-like enzyme
VKTPHLDHFAAEGMKFTSFYATAGTQEFSVGAASD